MYSIGAGFAHEDDAPGAVLAGDLKACRKPLFVHDAEQIKALLSLSFCPAVNTEKHLASLTGSGQCLESLEVDFEIVCGHRKPCQRNARLMRTFQKSHWIAEDFRSFAEDTEDWTLFLPLGWFAAIKLTHQCWATDVQDHIIIRKVTEIVERSMSRLLDI